MSDLISRADAIKALSEFYGYSIRMVDEITDLVNSIPSAEAEQVTGKLKNPCDSLLTEESNGYKEQKSKLDLINRELAMEQIANDNVAGGMERINEYNNSTEWNEYLDGISDAITTIFCDVPSAEAVSFEDAMEIRNTILFKEYMRGRRDAEAVQGDAISKRFISDAILQKISELNAQGEKAIPIAREFIRFKRFVDGITPIRAEAVQGEWEHWGSPFSDESEVIDTIVCSVCGARFIEPKDEPKGEYNYCPNCGARMKGGDNE